LQVAKTVKTGAFFIYSCQLTDDRTHGHAPAVRRLLRVFGIVDCPIVHESG